MVRAERTAFGARPWEDKIKMAKDNKKLVQAITSQEENFAQWYTDICVKAELVEYSSVKGFIILRPYGQAIWELIQKDMDARFKATGHENVAMPVLIPESLLQKEGELVNGFAPEVAWVTMGGSDKLEERLAAGEELTELTVDEILHKYRSAQDKFLTESFGTIAAYGPNAAMMHYHATEEDHAKLEKKGFLLVDSGATYMDGTTDITRTYPLGELTEDERLFYTWTLQCHIDIARAVWLDYCDGHMLDTIAREPLWRHLINYRCGTGHSVSFVGNVHEGPHALNGRNTTLMRPGMIVTDEPGVYEAGEVGIRIENEIECYHKADNQYGTFLAFRPLTFVPIATSPIVPGVLDKEQIAWLNDYHRKVFEQLAPRLTEDERAWLAEKCAAIGC